jgi:hypothetical protein
MIRRGPPRRARSASGIFDVFEVVAVPDRNLSPTAPRAPVVARSDRQASTGSPATNRTGGATAPPSAAAVDAVDAVDGRHGGAHARATGKAADGVPAQAPRAPHAAPLASGAVKRGLASAYNPGPDAGKLFAAMHGGMTGLGTDEAAIHAVLKDKSAADIQALRRAYADRYPGRNLDRDLASELSGRDLERAKAAMAGKKEAAAATGIAQALGGVRADAGAVISALEGKSPAELAKIRQAFQAQTGTSLNRALDRELGAADAARAQALLAGDRDQAAAARLHQAMDGVGTDEKAIHDTLAAIDPARRSAVEAAYSRTYGTSLRTDLTRELSGPDLDLARSLLDNDQAQATAARVRLAVGGVGTDEDALAAAFARTSNAERARVAEAYRARYGESLDQALTGDLGGRDLAEARTLAAHGALKDVQRVERAMRGAGTDEAALKAVLQGKTREEVAALDREFRARNGGQSLDDAIRRETGGRDQFELTMAMRGKVDLTTQAGIEEAARRARETRDFERAGLGNAIGRALTGAGSTGDVLDQNTDRVEQALARAKASGTPLSAADAARVRTLLGYQQDDVAQYRQARDAAADAAGTGAAVIAGVAATVATGGAAAPLVIAAGAAAGAATKATVGAAVRGELREDASLNDVRAGAVDGVATAVAGLATRGIGTVISRTMSAGESAVARVGAATGTRAPASAVVAAAETAPARGFVGSTIEKSLTGAGRGTVSGTTSGATSAAFDPNTYRGDLVGAVATIASSAALGARNGLIGGVDPTAAVAGTAVSRLTPRLDQVTGAALSRAGVDVRATTEAAGTARVVQQAAVSFAVETPKKALEGAAAATLGALLTGNPDAILTAATDAAAERTATSAKEVAVDATKKTVNRRLQR